MAARRSQRASTQGVKNSDETSPYQFCGDNVHFSGESIPPSRNSFQINRHLFFCITKTLSHALFHLTACFLEYTPELRGEVKEIVAKKGWTKSSVSKMFKLDSFLRKTM